MAPLKLTYIHMVLGDLITQASFDGTNWDTTLAVFPDADTFLNSVAALVCATGGANVGYIVPGYSVFNFFRVLCS